MLRFYMIVVIRMQFKYTAIKSEVYMKIEILNINTKYKKCVCIYCENDIGKTLIRCLIGKCSSTRSLRFY